MVAGDVAGQRHGSQRRIGGDMRKSLGSRLTYANVVATGALFVVLGEAAAPFVHADCEIVRVGLPGGKRYTGVEGFRESWLDWLAPWAEYRSEVDEAIDCGETVVLLQRSS